MSAGGLPGVLGRIEWLGSTFEPPDRSPRESLQCAVLRCALPRTTKRVAQRAWRFRSLSRSTPAAVPAPDQGDGKVYAVGNNAWGQLGIGSTTRQAEPVIVSGRLLGCVSPLSLVRQEKRDS